MAEDRQPADIVEGATSGDVEDEVQPTAKSAEDRKAAAALSKLDTHGADDEGAGAREVDQEAVQNAMNALGGGVDKKEAPHKTVKVDAADVKLLVDEFELPKPKATELLKAHDGDAVRAMKGYLQPNF
ncbi:hypothetical protein N658DRAFT_497116 [Parathielavia hyrcaniae]|uniref:Nascent polypeptide-associated complex subunit alpha-like UBA domain-containing protein n=1 Tax=Parathielavia hyrcaniae TaxID=113614 RepID=A0AAN6PZF0_9PEZI|nr:hypothetical protein N658DRAFT_497116 [Parathielavia hyrcaniae]